MITKAERRFIDQWLEQKSGPRWKYYFQFSVAWTVVAFLVTFFLLKIFTDAWESGGKNFVFILIGFAAVVGFLSTHFTYVRNEKKYRDIMRRQEEDPARQKP
ncbi:MAG: hypothetical protein KGM98_15565 [Bacteroidota bacterium]|nr:hypothetical protein [Bacteroidota bacterium]